MLNYLYILVVHQINYDLKLKYTYLDISYHVFSDYL